MKQCCCLDFQKTHPRAINVAGQQFEHLVVLNEHASANSRLWWKCQCDCGNITWAIFHELNNRHKTSCGCRKGRFSHGHGRKGKRSRLFLIYHEMKQRCLNPNKPEYGRYGGRGITVCERWLESFENFALDMGEPPSPLHTLDRYPDNDGNYSPANCRWATRKEQQRNRRVNHMLTAFGETKSLAEWAESRDMSWHTLKGRIRLGWAIEDALTVPIRPKS